MNEKVSTLLILGGTAEARALAQAIHTARPELDVITSLAGVTDAPADFPGRVRTGGFGGADGLARYLVENHIAAVIDATHPYAAQITRHAVTACTKMGTPYLRLDRPPWIMPTDADVIFVPDADEAARLVARTSSAAFVTVGSKGLAPFHGIDKVKLVVRVMTAPQPGETIPGAHYVIDRPPFDVAAEEALMRAHGIDTLVTKDAGGAATRAKLDAAARVGARIVTLRRPPPPDALRVSDVAAALAWLDDTLR